MQERAGAGTGCRSRMDLDHKHTSHTRNTRINSRNVYRSQSSSSGSRLFLDGKGMASGGGINSMFNKHLLGDVIRALQPRNLNQAMEAIAGNIKGARKLNTTVIPNMDEIIESAPSWERLTEKLLTKQRTQTASNKEERQFRELLAKGKIASPLASLRLFGNDKEPRVVLWRDHAAWCPYCQKVWIALEEKQVSYEIKKVAMNCYASGSKPADFLKVQPSGNLPCAIIQGQGDGNGDNDEAMIIMSESDEILDVIDQMGTAPGTPTLRPEGQEELIRKLCDDGPYNSLERQAYREWLWYLTGKRKPAEYRERFEFQLDQIEEALLCANSSSNGAGPYFLGKHVSLVDIKFIPFVERMVASTAYFKGWDIRVGSESRNRWPFLNQWLEAMEARPSYAVTKSDYYTHSRALPPQLGGGCHSDLATPEALAMRQSIDALHLPTRELRGLDSTANTSTLPPVASLLTWREPGWPRRPQEPSSARREAAERLLHNHEAIVNFACRAAGTPGFPPASAELADPRAVDNPDNYAVLVPVVDTFLRHVVDALLSNTSTSKSTITTGAEATAALMLVQDQSDQTSGSNNNCHSDAIIEIFDVVVDCLDYLRARIGVPRDMSYPAATELRTELLNVSRSLLLLQNVMVEQ
jgi:glutathione S-transferase